MRTRFAYKMFNLPLEFLLTINDATSEKVIQQLHKQLNLTHCCYMVTYAWVGVKCVTWKRAWSIPVNYIDETIREKMDDNVTTDVEETLPALIQYRDSIVVITLRRDRMVSM